MCADGRWVILQGARVWSGSSVQDKPDVSGEWHKPLSMGIAFPDSLKTFTKSDTATNLVGCGRYSTLECRRSSFAQSLSSAKSYDMTVG